MGWRVVLALAVPCVLLLYFPSYTFSSSFCNPLDSAALLQFKNSFVLNPLLDDSWHPSNPCSDFPSKTESWKDGTNCCQWDGVTCDAMSGNVIALDLSCSNLEGEFHPNSTLFTLSHLQKLNLAHNNFSGSSIQSGIGDLVNLLHLDLSHSGFSGDIPSTISHLSKLVSLNLSNYNWRVIQFGPSYPRMRLDPHTWKNLIQNATKLREIRLDNVDMSSTKESSLSLLANLSFSLVSLSLADTQLQGNNMPTHILCFPNLKILNLEDNFNLGGELPKSNWSTHLSFLSLSNCSLEGLLPSSLFNLTQLSRLDLSANKLVGAIPRWCYSLPSLIDLDLSDNHFTGSIGEFSTYSLESLSLSKNRLHGNFPNSIFELQNLTDIRLSSTDLSGHLDFYQFLKLPSLFRLDLSHNLFTGSISDFSSRSLETLDLSNNKLHGSIPQWFHEKLWENIEIVDLSFNKLQGDLPSAMCNAGSLYILNLAHNNLTGLIPHCLGTFPFLSVLDLQMNNFYGSMPQTFTKKNAFETIKLNGNQLEGPLPRSLSHCKYLRVLDLGNNNIEDSFPHWLDTLQELQVLSLRSNKFHGVITCFSTKHPFPMLRIFDVSNNNFSGPLPASCIKKFQGMMNVNDNQTGLEYMGNYYFYNDSVVVVMKGQNMELERILTTFTTIDLSNNMLEGEIPKVIGEFHSLKGLNLSHNRMTGSIPPSLANLKNLEWLDLSWNQLMGAIPVALRNLNFLAVLNLSQNHFEGTIPTGGQFNTFGNDSYVGNPMLCGLPLSKSCNEDEEWETHSTFDNEESVFGWKGVAVGYGCGMLFGMLLGYNVLITGKPDGLQDLLNVC